MAGATYKRVMLEIDSVKFFPVEAKYTLNRQANNVGRRVGESLVGRAYAWVDAAAIDNISQNNQVEHGADVVGRPARRHVEIDGPPIHLGQGPAEPFLRARQLAFHLTQCLQEFVEPLLIVSVCAPSATPPA